MGSAAPSYRDGNTGLNFGGHYTCRKVGEKARRPAMPPNTPDGPAGGATPAMRTERRGWSMANEEADL